MEHRDSRLAVPPSPLEEWTARRLGVVRVTRAAVERWQTERLREVVTWVHERSPVYRDLYRDVDIERLTVDLADRGYGMAALPFIDSDLLRERGQQLICVSLGDIARVVTLPTSGSTGAPKRLWFAEEDLELTADHFRHGMRALIEPGGRLLVLMPGSIPGSVGALLRAGLGRDGITVESYGFLDDCAAVAARIVEFGAECLVGVPAQLVRLARSRAGRAIGRGRIRTVLTSGDHVTPVMRAAIEDAWDCRVFEHYGSTEIGLGGAVQCRAFAGLHVREADLLFEVVDPATGERLSDGAAGELVVTTLTRRGMPLIRYRTGDLVQMAADPCACGCELRSLKTVIGRRADMVPLRGERSRGGAAAGHTSPGAVLGVVDLDEAVYAAPAVLGFTATLIGAATGDQLVLKVEVEPPVPAGVAAEVQHRVEALPVLQDALEWGSLTVAVEISSDAANLAQSAKQRIVDERSGG